MRNECRLNEEETLLKGHVRKRGSKWAFVVDIGRDPLIGKRKQKWFHGYRTKREAEKAMAKKIAEISSGNYVEPVSISFQNLLDDWLEHYVKHRTSPKTLETYKYLVSRHIVPQIGNLAIDKLTPYQLQKLYSYLLDHDANAGKKLSKTTVHHIHRICYGALKWAVQMRMIPHNVAESVTPPQRNKREIKTWTQKQVNRFLEEAKKEWLYPLFFVAIATGLRRGELLGLKWGDVNLDQGTLSIRRTVQRTDAGLVVREQTKTDYSRRIVSISPTTVDLLSKHRRKQAEQLKSLGKKSDFVFTNTVGNILEPRKVNQVFDRVIRRAGLPKIRFHDLRHTHATLLLQQGIHPKIVSERLGHANISVTMDIYSHVIPSMQQKATKMFDQILDQDTLSD